MKFILAAVFMLLLLSSCTWGDGAIAHARAVRIFQFAGEHTYIIRNHRQTQAQAGIRLYDRDRAVTGYDATMFLMLNADSLMQMDASTTVEVNRVDARNLSLTLVEGGISVDVQREHPDSEYEVRAGNIGLVVRGTSFIVEYRNATVTIVMLEGYGEVNGIPIEAGEAVVAESHVSAPAVVPVEVANIQSPFVLNEIEHHEAQRYGEGIRVVLVAAGAPHSEAAVVMEFDLMELYLDGGFSEAIVWPHDGLFAARMYTDDTVSAATFVRDFMLVVYEGRWRCENNPDCLEGRVFDWDTRRWVDCDCQEEMTAILRDHSGR